MLTKYKNIFEKLLTLENQAATVDFQMINTPHDRPLFYDWARSKISEYCAIYIDDFDETPNAPPRKGIAPGQKYPFSRSKFEAAIFSVLYGSKLGKIPLVGVLDLMASPPSQALFRVWRTQPRFKAAVEDLRKEYAMCIAKNIFYGQSEKYHFGKQLIPEKGLYRKILIIQEACNYSPDLLAAINHALADLIFRLGYKKAISNFLGHHIWCVLSLDMANFFGKKSRQRAIYLDTCKNIVGVHWRDNFFYKYFSENYLDLAGKLSGGEYHSGLLLERANALLAEGNIKAVREFYLEEFGGILSAEVLKSENSSNMVDLVDVAVGVKYLAGEYNFYQW